jgi:hypothetical protein
MACLAYTARLPVDYPVPHVRRIGHVMAARTRRLSMLVVMRDDIDELQVGRAHAELRFASVMEVIVGT